MKAELKIFIAGSKALKQQRTLIRDVASNLATDYERKGRNVKLSVYSFDNFGLTFDKNGQQNNYNEFIRNQADLVIFVFENKAGGITLDEFNVAYGTYARKKRPQICVFSKKSPVGNADLDSLRGRVNALNQYYNEYEDDMELERLVEKLLRDNMDAALYKATRRSFFKSLALTTAVLLAIVSALILPKNPQTDDDLRPQAAVQAQLQAPAPAPQAVVTNQPVPQVEKTPPAPVHTVASQPKPAVQSAPQQQVQTVAEPAAPAPKQVSYENVTIRFSVPDMDIRLIKCAARGTSAYVDFTMTNNTGKDVQGLSLASEMMAGYENYVTVVYDDQGNIYKPGSGISSVKIADDTFTPSLAAQPFAMPSGIPVKFRVRLVNVDDSVSEIKLLKMNFRGLDEGTVYGVSLLEIRDIPIAR